MAKKKSVNTDVTVSLEEIMLSVQVLQPLINGRMPPKVVFKVRRLLKALEPEVDVFHETKADLLKEFAVTDSDENQVTQEDGTPELTDEQEYDKKFKELLSKELELSLELLTLEDVSTIKTYDVSGNLNLWEPTLYELDLIMYLLVEGQG